MIKLLRADQAKLSTITMRSLHVGRMELCKRDELSVQNKKKKKNTKGGKNSLMAVRMGSFLASVVTMTYRIAVCAEFNTVKLEKKESVNMGIQSVGYGRGTFD